jgi:hypothetical protein
MMAVLAAAASASSSCRALLRPLGDDRPFPIEYALWLFSTSSSVKFGVA